MGRSLAKELVKKGVQRMGADLSRIDILTRREIEARIAGPLIRAFTDEIGQDRNPRDCQDCNRITCTRERCPTGKADGR